MTDFQFALKGNVRGSQVMPSVDEATAAAPDWVWPTAANTPPPYVTDFQFALIGSVLVVQVMPSVDAAAAVVKVPPEPATATNNPLPYVTEFQT